ncbi:MAG TPA: chemotaxis response regulator protein-glutamate methylesterase [Chloroflexota bacterium]|nr:chemotaxis response regulator protein-glutamate methylesterase [Chloroflexota bacterium]
MSVTRGDGAEAVEKVAQLRPDVVTMDVEMPRMNGIEAVEAIMRQTPTPVVMLSGVTLRGAAVTIEALAKGAIDFVTKPTGGSEADLATLRDELKDKLRRAARLSSARLAAARLASGPPPAPVGARPAFRPLGLAQRARKVVAIGASTGGPAALTQLLPQLPGDMAAGVLVVQHMPAGFTKALADRLNGLSQLTVREAVAGELVQNGTALVAPGDFHMAVDGSGHVVLNQSPPVHSVRPAADVLLASVAKTYGRLALGVVLTGMGHDGAAGATDVKRAGGQVIVQDEASSVVYGMAASVVEAGSADAIVPLTHIASRIVQALL